MGKLRALAAVVSLGNAVPCLFNHSPGERAMVWGGLCCQLYLHLNSSWQAGVQSAGLFFVSIYNVMLREVKQTVSRS